MRVIQTCIKARMLFFRFDNLICWTVFKSFKFLTTGISKSNVTMKIWWYSRWRPNEAGEIFSRSSSFHAGISVPMPRDVCVSVGAAKSWLVNWKTTHLTSVNDDKGCFLRVTVCIRPSSGRCIKPSSTDHSGENAISVELHRNLVVA